MNNFVYEEKDGNYRLVILVGSVEIPTTIKDWCTEEEMRQFTATLCIKFSEFTKELKEKL